MSFELNENDEVLNEINMTPLVDVMLVLLIIFIITIPVVQHAVKVELPRANSSKDKMPLENLQLVVDAQGQFFLAKQLVAPDALEDALLILAAKDPQPQLYDLSVDLGEKRNLAAGHPDVVRDLTARLARIRERGRSRP